MRGILPGERTSLGRITPKRTQRAMAHNDEVELWHRDFVGTVLKDENGVPKWFRIRCKNKACCQPTYGMIAVHVWDLSTGEFVTRTIPEDR